MNGAGMQVFPNAFAKTIADDEHVALVLDGAGWHGGMDTSRRSRHTRIMKVKP